MRWKAASIVLTQDEDFWTANDFVILSELSARIRGGTRVTICNTGPREIQFRFSWPRISQKMEKQIHLCAPDQKFSLDIPPTQCLVYQWRMA